MGAVPVPGWPACNPRNGLGGRDRGIAGIGVNIAVRPLVPERVSSSSRPRVRLLVAGLRVRGQGASITEGR